MQFVEFQTMITMSHDKGKEGEKVQFIKEMHEEFHLVWLYNIVHSD